MTNNNSPVYLDSAATTQIDPEVAEALSTAFLEFGANPASQHRAGRRAKSAIEDARDQLKCLLLDTSSPRRLLDWELVFTSGGTEANNLAILGLVSSRNSFWFASTEHPSILATAQYLRSLGKSVEEIPVDPSGRIRLDRLEILFNSLTSSDHRPLVAVMLGNNETGAIQPIAEVSALCRKNGAVLHCDVVQAFGKIELNADQLGADSYSISAHKIHGPVGIGALLFRSNHPLAATTFGGGQQLGLRPGTESTALATAFSLAAEKSCRLLRSGTYRVVAELRDRFEQSLLSLVPQVTVNAAEADRLPHISSLAFDGLDRQALLMALDLVDVYCSSGSACASGSSQPSHVLQAMGLSERIVRSSLRFSLARTTLPDEIELAVGRISRIAHSLFANPS